MTQRRMNSRHDEGNCMQSTVNTGSMWNSKASKLKIIIVLAFPVAQWIKDPALLQLPVGHSSDLGSIPGSGTSICLGCG